MEKIWIVSGKRNSWERWELFFAGGKPTQERINFIYADIFKEEWEASGFAYTTEIKEISAKDMHSSKGDELKRVAHPETGE